MLNIACETAGPKIGFFPTSGWALLDPDPKEIIFPINKDPNAYTPSSRDIPKENASGAPRYNYNEKWNWP